MPELAKSFNVDDKQLIGIVHLPEQPVKSDVAVLIVVGGPQTRVGSHRQFVLLSRYLMSRGLYSMRFDYSAMGDSDGKNEDFLNISADIHGAIALLKAETGCSKVVLWGLCDAASSALLYQRQYPENDVEGMVLLNPWVRSEQGEAKTLVKHYYLNRLKDKSLWKKILRLEFDFTGSFKSLCGNLKKMLSKSHAPQKSIAEASTEDNYIQHMLEGFQSFSKSALLVISGDDLTAAEFLELAKSSDAWQQQIDKKVSLTHTMPSANHTFSRQAWRAEVEKVTADWIISLD